MVVYVYVGFFEFVDFFEQCFGGQNDVVVDVVGDVFMYDV